MNQLKLIKLDSNGEALPDSAPQWDGVSLPDHGLIFSARPINTDEASQYDLQKMASELTLCGRSDWDLPQLDGELDLLIDRSRYSPAINTDFFCDIPNDWFWTKQECAWGKDDAGSSASAWLVNFDNGDVSLNHRSLSGFALAVCRVGQ